MANEPETTLVLGPLEDEQPRGPQPLQVLVALCYGLHEVAIAELAKGPSLSSLAWQNIAALTSEVIGEAPPAAAVPVVGRQPRIMPPTPRGGTGGRPYAATVPPAKPGPPAPPAPTIKDRPDVAAELARVGGGTPKP